MGTITDEERDHCIKNSPLHSVYAEATDPDSAYEFLVRKGLDEEAEAEKAAAEAAAAKEAEKAELAAMKEREKAEQAAAKEEEKKKKQRQKSAQSVATPSRALWAERSAGRSEVNSAASESGLAAI
jgi:FKBP-type peptidyl-prolyl cis-trans isomerase